MKISVLGLGYVGSSIAVLLAKHNNVVGYDIDQKKVESLNRGVSPVDDDYMSKFMKNISIRASLDIKEVLIDSDYIFIATPTDYDEETNVFNTKSIEESLNLINKYNKKAICIIKSTIPIGYTDKIRLDFPDLTIIFSPEFLREGKSLYDNHYPSRIVVGDKTEIGEKISNLLKEPALKEDVEVVLVGSKEAESIKLFANSYLAMRVAFFNELDSFCEFMGLNTKEIIDGVCLDERIGDFYNNPSFGYGGYCFPKDTKQLLTNFKNVKNKMITAIVESNYLRKEFVADRIIEKKPKVVGVYKLAMKTGSNNFRSSSIIDVMDILHSRNIEIIIYEPILKQSYFDNYKLYDNFDEFCEKSDIIIANRNSKKLAKYSDKLYTRDIFRRD